MTQLSRTDQKSGGGTNLENLSKIINHRTSRDNHKIFDEIFGLHRIRSIR